MSITLANVIAHIESTDFTNALRYEPSKYGSTRWSATNATVASINKCSRDTAEIIMSTSFGKYQIMGSNLYGVLAYADTIANYLVSNEAQDSTFYAYLDNHHINFPIEDMASDDNKIIAFAKAYNGPGNVAAYVDLIKAAYNYLTALEKEKH